MELGLKLAAGAALAALLAATLRRNAPEISMLIALAAGVLILSAASGALGEVVGLLGRLAGLAGVDTQILLPVVKVAGLSLLTHLTAELCRAAGEGGIAAFLQTAGTILALVAAAPLVTALLDLIGEMAG